jgi:hypothetical protein
LKSTPKQSSEPELWRSIPINITENLPLDLRANFLLKKIRPEKFFSGLKD